MRSKVRSALRAAEQRGAKLAWCAREVGVESAPALARGELCCARLLEPDGAVSATQLGQRIGACYYQIQEGFDPAREDERVGTALRGLAVAELIVRGVRTYDFMAGDSQHKRDWGGAPRPCTTLAFPLPKWRARLAYGLRARVERWRSARERTLPAAAPPAD
ncbi:MAG: GNAT family N-acetyltransferase [Planctomycetes bacterium]|nr:GNAT family N-acetyltransferase [Planctomycetota bacterium]